MMEYLNMILSSDDVIECVYVCVCVGVCICVYSYNIA